MAEPDKMDETAVIDPADLPANPPVYNPYAVIDGRNPKWGDPDHVMLLVEVNFDAYGWIPFATPVADFPDDPTQAHCQIIAEAALAGDYGPIAEYQPPTLDYMRSVAVPMGRVDFRNSMAAIGVTTTVINEYLADITDPAHKEQMTIFWEDSQIFQRLDPFVTELGAYAGKTPEELDGVFKVGT